MKKTSLLLAVLAISLTPILSGCATNATNRLLDDSAAKKGAADAGVDLGRQPDDCGKPYPLLPKSQLVGHDKMSGIARYEDYITGTINPEKKACYDYNEQVRKGVSHADGK